MEEQREKITQLQKKEVRQPDFPIEQVILSSSIPSTLLQLTDHERITD
jgi:hypothetical protein